jgi:hypothetical protein
MPISITPTIPLNKPLRISVSLPLDVIRHYDPSITPWTPSDSASSLMRKSQKALNSIARDIITTLFGLATTVPEDVHPTTIAKNSITSAITLRLDYEINANDKNPKVLQLSAQRGDKGGNIVFAATEMGDTQKEWFNNNVTFIMCTMEELNASGRLLASL